MRMKAAHPVICRRATNLSLDADLVSEARCASDARALVCPSGRDRHHPGSAATVGARHEEPTHSIVESNQLG